MKHLYFLIPLALMLFYSCNQGYNVDREIEESCDLIERMQFQKAYDKLTVVLNHDYKNARALKHRGVAAFNMGRLEEAFHDFQNSYNIDSLDAGINLNLGVYFGRTGDFEKSKKYYRRTISLDSSNIRAHSNLGVVLTKLGKLDEALKCHEKAISLDSTVWGVYGNRSETYLAMGDTSNTLKDYNAILNCNVPNSIAFKTLFRRGMLMRSMKDYQSAVNDFTAAIGIFDKNTNAYYYRGLSYSGLNNFELALKDFKMAKRLGRRNVDKVIEECELCLTD